MTDLCGELRVSPNTLNVALRELESEGWVVRRHAVGIFVAGDAPRRAAQLALICRPELFRTAGHSPFWDLLVEDIHQRAAQNGRSLDPFFCRSGNAENPLPDALAEAIESERFGGVLGVGLPNVAANWIMERGVPVVNLYGKGHATFITDGARQIEMCVEALQMRGCRRAELWMSVATPEADNSQFSIQNLLSEAFRGASGRANMEMGRIEDNRRWLEASEVPSRAEQGYQSARKLFESPRENWPDGLVITDDTMTHGVLVAMRRLGLHAGRDVQIATAANANSPILSGESGLILAEVDPAAVVEGMFSRLEVLLQTPELPKQDEIFVIAPTLREIEVGRPIFA